jgi:hypothetical protein
MASHKNKTPKHTKGGGFGCGLRQSHLANRQTAERKTQIAERKTLTITRGNRTLPSPAGIERRVSLIGPTHHCSPPFIVSPAHVLSPPTALFVPHARSSPKLRHHIDAPPCRHLKSKNVAAYCRPRRPSLRWRRPPHPLPLLAPSFLHGPLCLLQGPWGSSRCCHSHPPLLSSATSIASSGIRRCCRRH